jgi:hypothetical protein
MVSQSYSIIALFSIGEFGSPGTNQNAQLRSHGFLLAEDH